MSFYVFVQTDETFRLKREWYFALCMFLKMKDFDAQFVDYRYRLAKWNPSLKMKDFDAKFVDFGYRSAIKRNQQKLVAKNGLSYVTSFLLPYFL